MSDYCPVIVVRKHNGSFAKMNTHKTIKYRNYKNFDHASFCEDLESAPWSLLHIADDPNETLDVFEQVYTKVLNEHAPLVENMVKALPQPPWFNDTLLNPFRKGTLYYILLTKPNTKLLCYYTKRLEMTHRI